MSNFYRYVVSCFSLSLAFFFNVTTFSQDLTFPIRNMSDIKYANPSEVSKEYSKYPYTDVSIIFGNGSKLGSSEFVRNNFKSVEYFYGQINLSGKNASQKIPLFLFQKKENNTFNTSLLESKTIIKKYLVANTSEDNLECSLITDIEIKNNLLNVLNSISKTFSPLITKPTSLLSKGIAEKTFEFFTTTLEQASQNKKIEARVDFELFQNEYKKIGSHKIYIFAPSDVILPKADDLKLVKASSGFVIQYRGQDYEQFPYLIIVKTLSNYNPIQELPSRHVERGYTTITDQNIRELDSIILTNSSKLSDQQIYAEKILLDYLKIINLTENAIKHPSFEILKLAYDGMIHYSDINNRAKNIESSLYSDQTALYQSKIRSLEAQINIYADRLTYYKTLIDIEKYASYNTPFTNEALGNLSSHIEKISKIEYLKNNTIFINGVEKLKDEELYLFNKHFRLDCEKLSIAEELNEEANNSKVNLQNKSLTYSNCAKCKIESKASLSSYSNLASVEDDRRLIKAITDTIFFSTDVVRLYKGKFENYKALHDSVKNTLNLKRDLELFQRDLTEIEQRISEITSISRSKFNKAQRKDIYANLFDLKMLVIRLDANYKLVFEKLGQV